MATPRHPVVHHPLTLKIEFDAISAYVRYSHADVTYSRDAWDDGRVSADFDSNGAIVGIEVVGLDAEVIREAAAFAAQHCLGFPAQLHGS